MTTSTMGHLYTQSVLASISEVQGNRKGVRYIAFPRHWGFENALINDS